MISVILYIYVKSVVTCCIPQLNTESEDHLVCALGYSHFPKGGAIDRFWIFNEITLISFSSLFLHQKNALVTLTVHKKFISVISNSITITVLLLLVLVSV